MSTLDIWKTKFQESNQPMVPGNTTNDWDKILRWYKLSEKMANNPILLLNIPENIKKPLAYIIKFLIEHSENNGIDALDVIAELVIYCNKSLTDKEKESELVIFKLLNKVDEILKSKTPDKPYLPLKYSFMPKISRIPKDKLEEYDAIMNCNSSKPLGDLVNNSLVPDFTSHFKPELIDILFINNYLGLADPDETKITQLKYNPCDFITRLDEKKVLKQENLEELNELDMLRESKKSDNEVEYKYGIMLSSIWVNIILCILENINELPLPIGSAGADETDFYENIRKKLDSVSDFIILMIENRIYSKMNRTGLELPKDLFYNFKQYLDAIVERGKPVTDYSSVCTNYRKMLFYFYKKLALILERSKVIEITTQECFYDLFDQIDISESEGCIYYDKERTYPLRTIHFRKDFIIEPTTGITIDNYNFPKQFWFDIDKSVCLKEKKPLSLFLGILSEATRLEPLYNVLSWELGAKFISGGFDSTNTLTELGKKVDDIKKTYCEKLDTITAPFIYRYGVEKGTTSDSDSLWLFHRTGFDAYSLMISDNIKNQKAIDLIKIMYEYCKEGPGIKLENIIHGLTDLTFNSNNDLLQNLYTIAEFYKKDLLQTGMTITEDDFKNIMPYNKYNTLFKFLKDPVNRDVILISDLYNSAGCLIEIILDIKEADRVFTPNKLSDGVKNKIVPHVATPKPTPPPTPVATPVASPVATPVASPVETPVAPAPTPAAAPAARSSLSNLAPIVFDLEDSQDIQYDNTTRWAEWNTLNKMELLKKDFVKTQLTSVNAACNVFYLKWCMKNREELYKDSQTIQIMGGKKNGWENWGWYAGTYYSEAGSVEFPFTDQPGSKTWVTIFAELRQSENKKTIIKTVEDFNFKINLEAEESKLFDILEEDKRQKFKIFISQIMIGLREAYGMGDDKKDEQLRLLKWVKTQVVNLIVDLDKEMVENEDFRKQPSACQYFDDYLGINAMITFLIIKNLPEGITIENIGMYEAVDKADYDKTVKESGFFQRIKDFAKSLIAPLFN